METLKQISKMMIVKIILVMALVFCLTSWLLVLPLIIYSKICGKFTDKDGEEENTFMKLIKNEGRMAFLIWDPERFFEVLVEL